MNSKQIIKELKKICGDKNVISDRNDLISYEMDWDKKSSGLCLCTVLPKNVMEVSKIVKFCHLNLISIIPQGGNTGLVGGTVPVLKKKEIIINLKRINEIYEIDVINFTADVGAGLILDNLNQKLIQHNLFFPLEMASSGSSQLGGNIATNAGGMNVIKYGNIRNNILGIEAVLPNGEIIQSLNKVTKNNTGYNLTNLMCGSEGTLGIITRSILKIYPLLDQSKTLLVAFTGLNNLLDFYRHFQKYFNTKIERCELLTNINFKLSLKHSLIKDFFFKTDHNFYLLIKLSYSEKKYDIYKDLDHFFTKFNNLFSDVLLSQSLKQEEDLWKFREIITEAQKIEGRVIHNDISVPIANLETFFHDCEKDLDDRIRDFIVYPFGHLGDGNVHYNIIITGNRENFETIENKVYEIVNKNVKKYDGSISAEHGIGLFKKNELIKFHDKNTLKLIKNIKKNIDPKNIMNRSKVIDL